MFRLTINDRTIRLIIKDPTNGKDGYFDLDIMDESNSYVLENYKDLQIFNPELPGYAPDVIVDSDYVSVEVKP